jgi:hypothetical protein
MGRLLGGFAIGFVATLSTLPAQAITTGFQSEYAPANWTFTNSNADGSVNTAGAPNSISLTGGNDNSGNFGTTSYTIAAAGTGTVSFNWLYTTPDSGFDSLVRLLNGVETFLSSNNGGSGIDSFAVNAGDIFGFRIVTSDNTSGAGTGTISNFSAPSAPDAVPFEFSPTLGLMLLGVGYGAQQGWKKWRSQGKKPDFQE